MFFEPRWQYIFLCFHSRQQNQFPLILTDYRLFKAICSITSLTIAQQKYVYAENTAKQISLNKNNISET